MNRYPAACSPRGTLHLQEEIEEIRHLLPDNRLSIARSGQRSFFKDEFQAAGLEIHSKYFSLDLLPEWRHSATNYGLCRIDEEVSSNQQVTLPIHPSLINEQVKTNGHSGNFLTSPCAYSF